MDTTIGTTTGEKPRRSLPFVVLIAFFLVACLMAYLVVRGAITQTVEQQALAMADVVAREATSARAVYAADIADKLKKDGFGPSVDSASLPGHVPIPAQFLRLMGQASMQSADKLYEYHPVSKWNLEPSQGLGDDFLRWAWPQLERQDRPHPTAPVAWQPVSRFEQQGAGRVLRYLVADPASQLSCVACHNAYESRPEVIARRTASGVRPGKQWQQHQLLGALSITVPLERAELLATSQTRRTSALVVGILLSAFVALSWMNLRLARQTRNLLETETQLASSELEARSAHALLQAKQGIEQALAELSTYIRAIDHHAIVSVADRSGRIVQVNDKFVEISGYSREELLGQDHRIINSGTHRSGFFAQMWATIGRGEIWRGVICNRAKSGKLYWVDSAIVPLRDAGGGVVRYISIRIDITERKQAEQEMLHIATHDGLTGLPNRTLLIDRIRQALAGDSRAKALAAVLFIDLDQFKAVNDSLGHDVGDLLLIEVGRRLQSCMRGEDTVARQGGDEFIVLLPRLPDAAGAGVLADKLLKSLLLPFRVAGMELHIGASIGIAVFPGDGEDVETLLKNSDTAMYQAKESGRNTFMFFTPQMNQTTVERYALTTDLRRALERDELLLNFQPIVDTATGGMVAMEVLLRWQHPVRGRVPPLQFVPLAETSGLIVPIGEWVLRSACLQIKAWQARGLQVPRLAINLSAVQFRTRSIFDTVSSILQETGTPPGALELEITEGVLMAHTDEVVAALARLNAMGVRIAIDDFGTGYSSLSYLKRLPIDTLKIDRSFVTDLASDAEDAAIVTAILALAHSLSLQVVAEGVETEAQRSFLQAQGCDHCQGYLFSQPLSAADMEALLKPA